MHLIDSHCHLHDPRLAGVLPDVLARARSVGVDRFVCCGTSEADWESVLNMAAQVKGVMPMLGLHPWYVSDAKQGWDARLLHLLETIPAGVGECGLDFAVPDANRDAQLAALETQWQISRELNRPLSLHCRKAFDDIFALAENCGLPPHGALIHAFSGSKEQAKIAIQHGFYLSFACSLMNPKNKRARSAIMTVPFDRLLLETDSPDISPIPGGLNEPANMAPLVNAAAELLGEKQVHLKNILQNNANKLFGSAL